MAACRLTLDEIKSIELDILVEFDAFCKKNNLKYFLSSGTLLGAVRHNGFIPWDDDIDVCMPRKDYEKFYELTRYNPVKKNLITSTYRKCLNKNCIAFIKLINIDTRVSPGPKVIGGIDGLWIDIVPVDYCKKDDAVFLKKYKNAFKKYNFLRTRIIYKENTRNMLSFIIKKCLQFLFTPAIPLILKYIDSLCRTNVPEGGGEYVMETLWSPVSNQIDRILPKNVFDVSYMEFEDFLFPVPKMYDLYLKSYFGNYMALPPENERGGHIISAYKISE